MMDPIGLALENYDVTGRWRVRDNGMPIDSQGELWDGTPVADADRICETRCSSAASRCCARSRRNLMAYATRPARRVLRHADHSHDRAQRRGQTTTVSRRTSWAS